MYFVILFLIFRGLRFRLRREDGGSTERMTSGLTFSFSNQSSGNLLRPARLRNSPGVTPIFFLNKRFMYSG